MICEAVSMETVQICLSSIANSHAGLALYANLIVSADDLVC